MNKMRQPCGFLITATGYYILMFLFWACLPLAQSNVFATSELTSRAMARVVDHEGETMEGSSQCGIQASSSLETSGKRNSPTVEDLKKKVSHADWKMISLVQKYPTISPDFNPAMACEVANQFIAMGEPETRKHMEKYAEAIETFNAGFNLDSDRLMLLCRTLFEAKNEKGHPPVSFAPKFAFSSEVRAIREYPLVLVDDIPFLLVPGYFYLYMSPDRKNANNSELKFCFEECRFRKKKFAFDYKKSNDALRTYLDSQQFKLLFDRDRNREGVSEYLLRQLQLAKNRSVVSYSGEAHQAERLSAYVWRSVERLRADSWDSVTTSSVMPF